VLFPLGVIMDNAAIKLIYKILCRSISSNLLILIQNFIKHTRIVNDVNSLGNNGFSDNFLK
jgi:hypothetical protein